MSARKRKPTRREREERLAAKRRSEIAKRAAETRRKNREREEREARRLARKRSEAAKLGWETRKKKARKRKRAAKAAAETRAQLPKPKRPPKRPAGAPPPPKPPKRKRPKPKPKPKRPRPPKGWKPQLPKPMRPKPPTVEELAAQAGKEEAAAFIRRARKFPRLPRETERQWYARLRGHARLENLRATVEASHWTREEKLVMAVERLLRRGASLRSLAKRSGMSEGDLMKLFITGGVY